MHGSTISTTVTHTVYLGSDGYNSPLTITATGAVAPVAAGSIGVMSSIAGGRLINHGTISGAGGYAGPDSSGPGGAGVDFTASGTVANAGTITGGRGGYGYSGGNGGAGVQTGAAVQISNTGTITGGDGLGSLSRGSTGGYGGAGVALAAGSSLVNHGSIAGGASFYSVGGTGVSAHDATVRNDGSIVGGQGAITGAYYRGGLPNGGAGVTLDGGMLINAGSITGGEGGASGYSGPTSGFGGVGVDLTAGAVAINNGSITGGQGGVTEYGRAEPGGSGVAVGKGGGRLVNRGHVYGGAGTFYSGQDYGGGNGGDGVFAAAAATIVNSGTIGGGYGGDDRALTAGYAGGAGGAGIDLAAGGTIMNSGTIIGGYGGAGDYGGAAGDGVDLTAGGMLINAGTIAGGAGGAGGYATGAAGGAGVYLNGGVLLNSGTIAGGVGGAGKTGTGATGDAVRFGAQAATLVVDPGAVFVGDIAANAAVDDTLQLANGRPGELLGLGSSITGFTTIQESAHATWTLFGSIGGSGVLSIGTGATLTLNGAVSIATLKFAAAGGDTLNVRPSSGFSAAFSGFGQGDTINLAGVDATSLKYQGGILELFGANGGLVAEFKFDGSYSAGDFALHAEAGGTALTYAGAADALFGGDLARDFHVFASLSGHGFIESGSFL
jgi:autotransporter family porin